VVDYVTRHIKDWNRYVFAMKAEETVGELNLVGFLVSGSLMGVVARMYYMNLSFHSQF
jgi:hypothetical protein